jgi:hypothetical protein
MCFCVSLEQNKSLLHSMQVWDSLKKKVCICKNFILKANKGKRGRESLAFHSKIHINC